MITAQQSPQLVAGIQYANSTAFFGLSADEKPTGVGNGSSFLEMDTGKVYFYDAANVRWIEWAVSG